MIIISFLLCLHHFGAISVPVLLLKGIDKFLSPCYNIQYYNLLIERERGYFGNEAQEICVEILYRIV